MTKLRIATPPRIKPFQLQLGFAHQTIPSTCSIFKSFSDDCVVGIETKGEQADALAAALLDTTQVAYKILMKKRFYIEAKKRLIIQFFKILSKQIKKQKVPEHSVAIFVQFLSERAWWAVTTPQLSLFRVRNGKTAVLFGSPIKSKRQISVSIAQLEPMALEGDTVPGDTFVVTNQTFRSTLNRKHLETSLSDTTSDNLKQKAEELMQIASKRRKEPHTITLIQRNLHYI